MLFYLVVTSTTLPPFTPPTLATLLIPHPLSWGGFGIHYHSLVTKYTLFIEPTQPTYGNVTVSPNKYHIKKPGWDCSSTTPTSKAKRERDKLVMPIIASFCRKYLHQYLEVEDWASEIGAGQMLMILHCAANMSQFVQQNINSVEGRLFRSNPGKKCTSLCLFCRWNPLCPSQSWLLA